VRFISCVGLAALSAVALLPAIAGKPAFASPVRYIVTSEDGDELKFYANKKSLTNSPNGVFYGSVGKNNKDDDVGVTTNSPLKIDNGYGEIKPDGGTLTSLTFTPANSDYDGMFFRGQLEGPKKAKEPFSGDIFATITDMSGSIFDLEWTGVKCCDADVGTLGFDEPPLASGDPIKSVEIYLGASDVGDGYSFKSVKQIDFSSVNGPSPTPLPSTWTMMLIGLAGLGGVGYRRSRKGALATAAA